MRLIQHPHNNSEQNTTQKIPPGLRTGRFLFSQKEFCNFKNHIDIPPNEWYNNTIQKVLVRRRAERRCNRMKVRFIGWGILLDAEHNEYVCDVDGEGHVQSCETGELYRISAKDENGNPIEIAPL